MARHAVEAKPERFLLEMRAGPFRFGYRSDKTSVGAMVRRGSRFLAYEVAWPGGLNTDFVGYAPGRFVDIAIRARPVEAGAWRR